LDLQNNKEEEMKHRGNEIYTNMHEFPLLNWGYFEPILPSLQANHRELVQCCLEFLTIQVGLLSDAPFPKQPSGLRITHSSNSMSH
jgi:hypothetical protein